MTAVAEFERKVLGPMFRRIKFQEYAVACRGRPSEIRQALIQKISARIREARPVLSSTEELEHPKSGFRPKTPFPGAELLI